MGNQIQSSQKTRERYVFDVTIYILAGNNRSRAAVFRGGTEEGIGSSCAGVCGRAGKHWRQRLDSEGVAEDFQLLPDGA